MPIADENGIRPAEKKSTAKILKYPEELASGLYPHIQFVCENPDSATDGKCAIHLPLVSNIAFGEGGDYENVKLGVVKPLATAADAGITAASREDSMLKALMAGGSAAFNTLKSQITDLNAAAKYQLAGAALGVDQNTLSLATKTIVNPNSRSAFTGNKIRSFSFSFKLVAKSEAETRAIREIAFAFRKGAYADSGADEFALRYPPIWQIRFFSSGAEENRYIPLVDREGCYLKDVTTTFNTSTNLFHEDGSPIELDVKLDFVETRLLKKSDIESLMLPIGAEKRGEKKTRKSLISSIKKVFKKNK